MLSGPLSPYHHHLVARHVSSELTLAPSIPHKLAMLRSTLSKALPARSFSTSSRAQHGIKSVGIVGTGQMGLGIGYVAAKVAGVPVVFMDKSEQQITKGFAFIGPSLSPLAALHSLIPAYWD